MRPEPEAQLLYGGPSAPFDLGPSRSTSSSAQAARTGPPPTWRPHRPPRGSGVGNPLNQILGYLIPAWAVI